MAGNRNRSNSAKIQTGAIASQDTARQFRKTGLFYEQATRMLLRLAVFGIKKITAESSLQQFIPVTASSSREAR
jgi:hypothetical protein